MVRKPSAIESGTQGSVAVFTSGAVEPDGQGTAVVRS